MEKAIGFVLLFIVGAILASHDITIITWEWWVIMVCISGWSVLSE